MINHLKGSITAIEQNVVTIDVAGLGFGLAVCRPEQYTINQQAHLITYLHWNQETGPQLFGFSSTTERHAFTLILSCAGIGPKIALSILSQLSPQEFLTAITLADAQKLSSLKGIGLKKAESMIMQLQDKVKKLTDAIPAIQEDNQTLSHIKNITDVLTSLHYSRQEIGHAIEHLKQNSSFVTAPFDDLLRRSLTFLAKQKNAL